MKMRPKLQSLRGLASLLLILVSPNLGCHYAKPYDIMTVVHALGGGRDDDPPQIPTGGKVIEQSSLAAPGTVTEMTLSHFARTIIPAASSAAPLGSFFYATAHELYLWEREGVETPLPLPVSLKERGVQLEVFLSAEPQGATRVVLLGILCTDTVRCAPPTPMNERPREIWQIEVDVQARRVIRFSKDPTPYPRVGDFLTLHGSHTYTCQAEGKGCVRIQWNRAQKTFSRDAQLPTDPSIYQELFPATPLRVFDLRIMPDQNVVISLRADNLTEPSVPTD